MKLCGPDPYSWFAPNLWPECACGFAPKDNVVLNKHWRDQGFSVVDHDGTLIMKVVGS